MKKRNSNVIIFFLLLFYSISYPQEILDKIVAIVDNEIILKSELDFQTQLLAYQRKLNPNDINLKKQVLNLMIEDKLVLAQAEIDSINVSEDEVTRQLDYQIEMFIQQYGSREKLEQTYGMTLEKIKRELRGDIRKKILVQKTQELHLGKIEISRQEVEEFFNLYKDSLGKVPEELKLSQIFITPKLSENVRKELLKKIELIIDSIKSGGNFADFAKRYSEHEETVKDGGDLGFVKRGQFFKEFEEVVFTLKEGEISGPVETPVGFHIIQLIERRGESVRARHILFKLRRSSDSDNSVISLLNSLRDSVLQGKRKFGELAAEYSEDKQSKEMFGDMGWFTLEELQGNVKEAIKNLKEGEISSPIKINISANNYGFQIIFVEKRVGEHQMNLAQDFERIQQLALMRKRQAKYISWISGLKETVNWETRLEGVL